VVSEALGIISNIFLTAKPYIFAPADTPHLTAYYLFWIIVFFLIHVIWDVLTKKTPPFHLTMLREKVSVLHHASTFCSSTLVLTSLVSPAVAKVATDTAVPLILAGLSGILQAIPALCPYKAAPPVWDKVERRKTVVQAASPADLQPATPIAPINQPN
jgi:hypothetical protein